MALPSVYGSYGDFISRVLCMNSNLLEKISMIFNNSLAMLIADNFTAISNLKK